MLRFGAMVQARSLRETRRVAEIADAAGFDWLGFPDSPLVWQDSFLHQAEALRSTGRLHVGPLVTHFTLRHPLTIANALNTLQDVGPGRVRAVVGTGNSAATGLGLRPATLAQVDQGIRFMRDWWAGAGSSFGGSRAPATGVARAPSPILIASDGPRGGRLAGAVGDGLVYSGGLDVDTIRERRTRLSSTWQLWVAPTFSLASHRAEASTEVGAQVAAMARRAIRPGSAPTLPPELEADFRRFAAGYDYGSHADSRRSTNARTASSSLLDLLTDRFAIWGDEVRWAEILETLASVCDGVMFILGHSDAEATISALAQRLRALGLMGDG